MAIVGVKTGLDITIQAVTLKTNLIWWMFDGTDKAPSNTITPGTAPFALGKALAPDGDRVAVRRIHMALNANQI